MEKWLLEFERCMKSSLKRLLALAIDNFVSLENQRFLRWSEDYPVQIVYLTVQLKWTNEMEEAVTTQNLNVQGRPFIYSGFRSLITSSFSKEFFKNFGTTCPHITSFLSEKILKV